MHPIHKPDYPSFLLPEYLEAESDLQIVLDVWNDLKGCISFYLHKELKEPTKAYQDRLKRTKFDNRFKPTIDGLSGLLSSFNLNDDIAVSIAENIENIDGLGNDLYTFLNECDRMVLRDGWCCVCVEFPPDDGSVASQADFLAANRKPYLVSIDRRNILNWDYEIIDGEAHLQQVTIREIRSAKIGRFGAKSEIYYRVLTPGMFEIYQIRETKQGHELVLIDSGQTSLDFIPLVYYSVSESALFATNPPLLGLANLNLEHFQKRSQLNEVLRKCNLPVPVRKGLIKSMADLKNAPPLTIGPNYALDIPPDGDFYFSEPSGKAIQATQQDIEKLEKSMDRLSLAFLSGNENQKTATEVLLNTAQTSATLKGMAKRKQSAIQQIFDYWIAYTGEPTGGTIDIDDSILQLPLPPEQISRLESLAQLGFISQESLLKELKAGKALSPDFDIDREVGLSQGGFDETQG